VCPGFVECPVVDQRRYAADHRLPGGLLEKPADSTRVALSWEELDDLCQRGHMVGSHTMTHCRLGAHVSQDELNFQIRDSRALLMKRLGRNIDGFCWVGGADGTYSATAARIIAQSGYRYAFMTCGGWTTPMTNPLQIHRTNVEDRYPDGIVALQTSGIPDYSSRRRRARINALTVDGAMAGPAAAASDQDGAAFDPRVQKHLPQERC